MDARAPGCSQHPGQGLFGSLGDIVATIQAGGGTSSSPSVAGLAEPVPAGSALVPFPSLVLFVRVDRGCSSGVTAVPFR